MKRMPLVLLFVIAPTLGGYMVGAAQPQVAHFKITVTTTDRGAGFKMVCERGCHWEDLSFGCGPSRTDCSGQVDESGVGNQRP